MIRTEETMSCDEILELLEPYVDGDLPGGTAARVRDHLGRCPSCAEELAVAEAIQRELRSLPQHDCPPEVLQRVLAAGRGEVVPFTARTPGFRWARPLRFAAAAAMLAAIVGGSVFFVQQQSGQPSPEEVAQATQEARLALAYVGKVTRRAGLGLRDDVLLQRLVDPATRSVRGLGALSGTAAQQ